MDLDDRRQLRGAFGTFATGVTIVTVGGDIPRGMTANSFTSVSLSPPLLLVCVDKDADMHRSLERSATFGVSVLGDGQEAVARHFADHSRPVGAGQFDSVDWRPGRTCDAPLITGASAHFECEKWRVYDAGDHTIFLGRLLRASRTTGAGALLFHEGRFGCPAEPGGDAHEGGRVA
ncbi:flavin reductase family protein [Streptomyces sp. RerS4]|uniref:flavin reductase family protein n=1 Tax=Streptomyces sp. RerS4 TaxID=2942449 RepID=UPI00201BF85A|nr:flavin reductase family protein [Streptomyces sp. RerS4]UQX05483.1 flavin reductase family protein [Streptomyces sp. RerS4]